MARWRRGEIPDLGRTIDRLILNRYGPQSSGGGPGRAADLKDATAYLIQHGYVVLFLWVAAEDLAMPVPSEPVLLAAGMLSGAGLLRLPSAIAVGVAASLLSDVIWYEIGRARGSQVMRLLCRISLEPDSCARRSFCSPGTAGGRSWSPSSCRG